MTRLTKYVDGEVKENHDNDTTPQEYRAGTNKFRNGGRAILERLAGYEDTGLTPREIWLLKRGLIYYGRITVSNGSAPCF